MFHPASPKRRGKFQQPLDGYVEGKLSLERMLTDTEYFKRWRLDPRMYAPIFEYARRHRLPLVALNASKELTDRVGEVGIEGLSPEERAELPETLVPLAPAYRERLEQVFEQHDHPGNDPVQVLCERVVLLPLQQFLCREIEAGDGTANCEYR